MTPIKIAIAEDHKLFRRLTKSYLQTVAQFDPDIAEAENGKDLLRKLRVRKPDVVLLDVNMPLMGGDEVARVIVQRYPEIKILVLTINNNAQKIMELMKIGVHGYLLKDCEPGEVVRAINAVVQNDFYHNEVTANALKQLESSTETAEERLMAELTNREKEILLQICGEHTMKEISKRLSISEKTVENHRMNMLHKLSVKNTVGLVKYAYEHGLIPSN
ncbi:MAG: response regulator transcription factor [Cytophagales bacterium]